MPEKESDSGNVTFTISSNDPKRSTDITLQIPIAEEIRERPPLVFDDKTRREAVGELVFTLISGNRSESGSNRKLFDIGEFLEFSTAVEEIPTITTVPVLVDLQHNTNLFDLVDIGLTQDEIDDVLDESAAKKKVLENQLASFRVQVDDVKVKISENQKRLNETTKALAAVREVKGIPEGSSTSDPIIDKLVANKTSLDKEKSSLISDLNGLNVQIKQTFDSLITVSGLVR